jgi:hypothetical protein
LFFLPLPNILEKLNFCEVVIVCVCGGGKRARGSVRLGGIEAGGEDGSGCGTSAINRVVVVGGEGLTQARRD